MDNPSAFPEIPIWPKPETISLLDYFAAKAMQPLLESEECDSYESVARHSYDIAEAMLAERERRMK